MSLGLVSFILHGRPGIEGGGHCQGSWVVQRPTGSPGPRVLKSAPCSRTRCAPFLRTCVQCLTQPGWGFQVGLGSSSSGEPQGQGLGPPTAGGRAWGMCPARPLSPSREAVGRARLFCLPPGRQRRGQNLGTRAASAADPWEPPSLSSPGGRCPGPEPAVMGGAPPPEPSPRGLAQW